MSLRRRAIGSNAPTSTQRNQPSHTDSPRPGIADAIQTVVPVAAAHQREAVRTHREAAIERSRAVLVQRRAEFTHTRHEVGVFGAVGDLLALEERCSFVEYRLHRR